LRCYAALVEHNPAWAGDGAASTMIELLLTAWSHLLIAGSHASTLDALRQGDSERALAGVPAASRADGRIAFVEIAQLGDPGVKAIEVLLATGQRLSAPRRTWIESEHAGLFLLLRAVVDTRLAGLVVQARWPRDDALPRLSSALLAIGLRLGGVDSRAEELDAGLTLLAGLPATPGSINAKRIWESTDREDHDRSQSLLLGLLAGQRLVGGMTLNLYQVGAGGALAIVAGGEPVGLWPLGAVVDRDVELGDTLGGWETAWQRATGSRPVIVADPDLVERLPEAAAVPPFTAAHAENRETVLAALAALDHGQLGLPDADLTIALTGIALLRAWARWLGPFASSSIPYILDNFVRRAGRIDVSEREIVIELEPRPLDVVLEMAGYLAPIDRVVWIDGRAVRFVIGGA
jgi:hypothetical protein